MRRWAGPVPTPAGPGRCLQPLPGTGPLECRLLANKARIDLIFLKLSQNPGVSPKYVQKACHSPCFQNGLQMSPLEISRFPFSPAFSHKELMGQKCRYPGLSVKMTKCRQMCTPWVREVDGQIPPRSTAASCPLSPAPHLTSARHPDGILNGPENERFAGDYD